MTHQFFVWNISDVTNISWITNISCNSPGVFFDPNKSLGVISDSITHFRVIGCIGIQGIQMNRFNRLKNIEALCSSRVKKNPGPVIKVNVTFSRYVEIRQLTLYSTDDKPSYELELCPTRNKSSHLSFFPPTCRIYFFIFLSSDISWPRKFIYLFFSFRHARKTPVGIRHP